MRHTMPRYTLLLLSALASTCALADPRSETITPSVSDWFTESEYTLGVGVAYGPEYTGSKQYHAAPYLNVHILTPGGFYADLLDGVGWQEEVIDKLTIAVGVGYDLGRTDKDSSSKAGSERLKGMGDVKSSVLGTAAVRYMITPSTQFSLSGEQALSNKDRGLSWHVELGQSFEFGKRDSLGIAAAAHLGNSQYNQAYFGVTDKQSRDSGFKEYKAGSGINSYGLTTNWTHKWTEHWSTDVIVGVNRVAGDAADSPLVERKTSQFGVVAVNYTF